MLLSLFPTCHIRADEGTSSLQGMSILVIVCVRAIMATPMHRQKYWLLECATSWARLGVVLLSRSSERQHMKSSTYHTIPDCLSPADWQPYSLTASNCQHFAEELRKVLNVASVSCSSGSLNSAARSKCEPAFGETWRAICRLSSKPMSTYMHVYLHMTCVFPRPP